VSNDPVLHVIAGPNGAGKSTFYRTVLEPTTHLDFVNADLLAAQNWPEDPAAHAYDAAELAEQLRSKLIDDRSSFVAETVFSHNSKIELLERALGAGYHVTLHVMLVPEEGAVERVADRVANAVGHDVPEAKIRSCYPRIWENVARATALADTTYVYDNSSSERAFRRIATYVGGALIGSADWPAWTPAPLLAL
jgi:predicted ABC-type ATPase